MFKFTLLSVAVAVAVAVPAWAQDTFQAAPEAAVAYTPKAGWTARNYMVVAANPLAVDAGCRMLRQGGSAIDAAIATHLVVVDAQGAGLSMTTTVEDAFGSRQMVDGFILNNQLTDFSFDSVDQDGPVANRVQAGKRPRSAKSPTIVFDKATGKLVLAIGSPGGPAIINYVAKVLVGTLDWGLDVQQAIALPNFGSRNGPTELEAGRFPAATVAALEARGHVVRQAEQTSGLHGVQRVTAGDAPGWIGGADPRREGVARGN